MDWSAFRRGRWLCALIVTAACGGSAGSGSGGSDFVVDNPGAGGGGGGQDGEGGDGGGSGGEEPGDGGDGGREVSEADIVFVDGDRIYALSAYAGLSIIDASAPDAALPVLGRHRMPGQPFEMYVDGGQVFAMLSDYGSYAWDEAVGGYAWHSASRLVALDASDPAQIVARGEFEIPGTIQDSRRVGDVLYLVTFEDGWCWGCEASRPRTVVTSLDVSNPAQVAIVDQLEFANQTDDPWDWAGPRSVSATDERMYVGGIEYDDWEDAHSVIDVLDISDPGGALVRGASVQIAGSIESRWQMDEFEGVLRVISQPWGWRVDDPPKVQTFTVASAGEISPLATLAMTLPRPETLQSVRFDGTRAYAVTFEQTDPLFTIDLTDPATPMQVGELEIPGWVHHMEPRGDRLLALGFDRDDPTGSINVSLFDVADLAAPELLSRVGFGGDWASFAEDQNRLHKAFTILEDLGLVMVPFSGWNYDEVEDEWGCGSYQSGIQLIDWTGDALLARGVAPAHGQARRALVHRDRLLAMSDSSLQSFDIADRDAPALRAQVALAANVADVAFGDGVIVRLANDWWTNETALEVVPASDPERAEPLGRLALADVSEGYACGWAWTRDVWVHEGYAYVLQESYRLSDVVDEGVQELVLEVVDIRDPSAPQWVTGLTLDFELGYGGWGLGLQNPERTALLVGDALVFASSESYYAGDENTHAQIEVIDLASAGAPTHAATLERPQAIAHGALQAIGDQVISWHMRAVEGDASKVRFYFDRFDVSSPGEPVALAPINVPGQTVAYDAAADRVVTVGFELEEIDAPEAGCWSHPLAWSFDYDDDRCTIAHRPLHLLAVEDDSARLLDTLAIEDEDTRLVAVMGTERVFAMVREGGDWGWADDGEGTFEPPQDAIAVVSGSAGDELVESSRVTLDRSGWSWLIGADGTTAVIRTDGGVAVLDAHDAAAPEVSVVGTWGWGCYDGTITDGALYCPMGAYGLQVVPLP